MVVGPARHGVVRFAEELVESVPDPGPVVRAATPDELAADWVRGLDGARTVHLHYTDALYAPRCEQAGTVFVGLVDQLRAAGLRPTVTLHDLPQPADGADLLRRRAAVYRRVVGCCEQVVVSSEHEAALLAAIDPPAAPVTVIGLPVHPPRRPTGSRRDGDTEVTVLGFVHPGKGHLEVLAAMAGLPLHHGLSVLGGAAPGHEDLLGVLVAAGARQGRAVGVSGYLSDDELVGRLHRAGVPVAAHRGVSASASINSWLSAGRRPLVPAGRHATELLARNPGSVWTYDDGALPDALVQALADPDRTWLSPGTRLHPTHDDVATAHAAVWARA